MSANNSATITILGATGYTGKLCARVAVDRGLDVLLAGRNAHKLETLAKELGGAQTAVVDVNDGIALRRLTERTGVLITTVGPYQRFGQPALLAAIDGGCHYIDISGEASFLAWAREHDEQAKAAGIALCPGFGFDGVPGDLLAGIAAATMSEAALEVRASYFIAHGRVSGGTLRSMVGMLEGSGIAWRDGKLVEEPLGADVWDAPFPAPLGTRASLSAPITDVLTLGVSTGAPQAQGYMALPATRVMAPLAGGFASLMGNVMKTPLGGAIQKLADRAPEGPDEAQRTRTWAAVIAEVRGATQTARAWCRLRDLYLTTGYISVDTAQRLLTHQPTGALTPTQCYGADAGALLQGIGADWAMC